MGEWAYNRNRKKKNTSRQALSVLLLLLFYWGWGGGAGGIYWLFIKIKNVPITRGGAYKWRAYKRQVTVLNANNFQSLLRYYFQSLTSSSESLGDSSPSASAIPHLASDRSTVSFGTTRPRLSKTGGGICRQICNFIFLSKILRLSHGNKQ